MHRNLYLFLFKYYYRLVVHMHSQPIKIGWLWYILVPTCLRVK